MGEIIGRDYCLKNPAKIINLYGVGIFLGMLFSKKKSLLQRVTESYRMRGVPMPGYAGNAYKISAMIEFRIAGLYSQIAKKFGDQVAVRDLFLELQQEEMEHGRLMLLCLYTIALKPNLSFFPSVRDPEIRELTNWLREIRKKIDFLSLEEILELTEKIEQGEVNTIFGKLLKQTDQSESHLFREQMELLKDHAQSVPLKINKLRQKQAA